MFLWDALVSCTFCADFWKPNRCISGKIHCKPGPIVSQLLANQILATRSTAAWQWRVAWDFSLAADGYWSQRSQLAKVTVLVPSPFLGSIIGHSFHSLRLWSSLTHFMLLGQSRLVQPLIILILLLSGSCLFVFLLSQSQQKNCCFLSQLTYSAWKKSPLWRSSVDLSISLDQGQHMICCIHSLLSTKCFSAWWQAQKVSVDFGNLRHRTTWCLRPSPTG